jgi:Holliday junction DNA helicase RuvB
MNATSSIKNNLYSLLYKIQKDTKKPHNSTQEKNPSTDKEKIVVKKMQTVVDTANIMRQTDFRPKTFKQIVGQAETIELLQIKIAAFKKTGTPVVHTLFLGPSGIGKTTFANVVALEMGVRFHQVMATKIKTDADLYNIIKNIEEGDVVFIDEIHALSTKIQEHLYGIMEDFTVSLEDKNLNAIVQHRIPRFTFIGATTHSGDLNAPLLSRFQLKVHLLPYNVQELKNMVITAGERIYGVTLPSEIAEKLARLSRRTARVAYNLLRSLMDIAEAQTPGKVTSDVLTMDLLFKMLKYEKIDPLIGLDVASRKYLVELIKESKAVRPTTSFEAVKPIPIGPKPLATLCSQQESTVTGMIEPYLLSEIELAFWDNDQKINKVEKSPFVRITKRGRIPLPSSVNYINICRSLQKQGWFVNESFNIKSE